MARLPQPGGDNGKWGEILNEFISISHANDGSLKPGSVGSAQLQSNAVTSSSIADGAIDINKINGLGSIATASNSDYIATSQRGVASGVATLDSTAKLSTSQLPGYLSATNLNNAYADSAIQRRSYDFPLDGLSQVYSPAPAFSFAKGSGLTSASIASGGSGYVVGEIITLAGGVFTTPAQVSVTSVSGGVITAVQVRKNGVYQTNPTSPASQATTSGSGTGATITIALGGGSACSIYDPVGVAWNASTIDFYGNGPTNGGSTIGNGTTSWFEWTSDADTFDIKMTAFNTPFDLFVDGKRISATQFSTDASGSQYILTVDFGSRSVRTYRLVGVNMQFNSIRLKATASVWKPNEPHRPYAWMLGDSYTFGTGASGTNRSSAYVMGEILGLNLLPDGVGGAGWTNSTQGTPLARVNAKLAPITHPPEYIFWDMGYNNGGGTPDTAAITAGFDAAIDRARELFPAARQFAFGPATPLGTTSGLTAVKEAISGRCTVKNVSFIDVEGWVTTTNRSLYTAGDNVHPSPEGHEYLGQRKARAIAALLASR